MIRIVIVEEMGLLRGALRAVLSNENDIEVAADIARIEETIPIAQAVRPDVVIIDIDLVADTSPSVASQLNDALPGCATLVLAGTNSPGTVQAALDWHLAGIVCKDREPSGLIRYVRQVAKGERVIDPMLAAAALRPRQNPLTEREREVLRLAALGVPTAEIAHQLFLSRGTVNNYMSAVLRKTGTRNRMEAIRWAHENGWL